MIIANDGGASVSHDAGKSWSSENKSADGAVLPCRSDTSVPYRVYGAQQDNSTVAIVSRSDNGAIDAPDWYDLAAAKQAYVVPDPRNPDIVYAGSYDGLITRFDKKTRQVQDISSWPLIRWRRRRGPQAPLPMDRAES